MNLTTSWDTTQIKPLLARGLERALFSTVSKSGGDAIRAARVASSRTVRFRKRMRAGVVNEALVLAYPKGKREISDLEWRVDVSGKFFTVSSFPYRQTKKGVSVAINKGKRKVIKRAFVARMKSGHVGVFRRTGKLRLPIEELFTTRIPDTFRDNGMVPAVHQRAQNVFSSSFSRLLPLEIAKLR